MIRRDHVRFCYDKDNINKTIVVTGAMRFEDQHRIDEAEDCPELRQKVEQRMADAAMRFVYGEIHDELLRLRSHVNSALAGAADPVAVGEHWNKVFGMLEGK